MHKAKVFQISAVFRLKTRGLLLAWLALGGGKSLKPLPLCCATWVPGVIPGDFRYQDYYIPAVTMHGRRRDEQFCSTLRVARDNHFKVRLPPMRWSEKLFTASP